MEHLNAPWRSVYFNKTKNENCVFCDLLDNPQSDVPNMVLFRDSKCYGVMNLYPYSPGHFLIVPNEHEKDLEDLDDETWSQMNLHVKNGVRMLKEVLGVKGVNIGMNLGKTAGAGIAEHLHYHLIPRRENDANFMTTIGKTRVNSVDFEEVYLKLIKNVPNYFYLG